MFILKQRLRMLEIRYIKRALSATEGNKSQAAKRLGMNRTTLVEKMRVFGFPLSAPMVMKQPNAVRPPEDML